MHRGGLGTRRRGEWRAVGGRGHGIGRIGDDDEGDGRGAEGFGEGNQEFGGVGGGDLLGAESRLGFRRLQRVVGGGMVRGRIGEGIKELELENVEHREFLKGLREKQVEEEEKQVEESVVVENEGEKEK